MAQGPELRARPEDQSHDGFRGELPNHLDRWVESSLITRQQRDAILDLERGTTVATRRIPLVTEALGYLGLLLIGGALVAILANLDVSLRSWEMVWGALAVILFVGGWALRSSSEPALARLAGVQWVASVAALMALALCVSVDLLPGNVADNSEEGVRVWASTGVASAVYAILLYRSRRKAPQLLAAYGTTVIAVPAVILLALSGPSDMSATVGALGGSVLGLAWLALARLGVAEPRRLASAFAAIAIALSPVWIAPASIPAAITVGMVSTAGLMIASVVWRETTLLWAGAAGLFIYVAWFIGRYLSDALGLPMALLLGGIALLALAVLTSRLRKSTA
jgi:hypothetical protein